VTFGERCRVLRRIAGVDPSIGQIFLVHLYWTEGRSSTGGSPAENCGSVTLPQSWEPERRWSPVSR
jgi:hypothetical protein